MTLMPTTQHKDMGFTLIELMITMVISCLVLGGIYMTFNSQSKSYLVQDDVAAMQQNVRAGVHYLESEIRMAGYNPGGVVPAPTITAAASNSITFRMDDGTGTGTITTYTYSYNNANRALDRNIGGGALPVAEDIQALGFAYAYDADADNQIDTYTDATGQDRIIWAVPSGGNWFNLDTNNDGIINDNDSPNPGASVTQALVGVNTGDSVNLDEIRAVRISLLARAEAGDSSFANNSIYIVGNQKIAPLNDGDTSNDDCRMRLLTTMVMCRNMGL